MSAYAEGVDNVLDLVDSVGLAELLGALRVEQTEVGVQRLPLLLPELRAEGVDGDVDGAPVRLELMKKATKKEERRKKVGHAPE